ncbi:hypothetical protein Rsub_01564 [Raphidocelis subcapitata]|uniref:AMP-activated protein kinase glycogen-binding domain-containing protein n=1 Tax=Raphidocelis subcapitata TaxID=307507 RepID=A0A2V0NV10_9CHLO|nr:hypothetical protein Rsub_01564 [Raphidocelis subcapitata]|eukprot:GBF88665.1 hypothetical protein Rsub_01564 [Raphidocelis subcapitata]
MQACALGASRARGGFASTASAPRPTLLGHARRPRSRARALDARGPAGQLQYPGEYSFNLAEYMVMLDKPVGLTLAPEPHTGRILVQRVHDGSPAATSRLIQVGDWLKSCSAVFGEEMWDCDDLQRTRWAIGNRAGKVKLVFERRGGGPPPLWYFAGKLGAASSDALEGQCVLNFDGSEAGAAGGGGGGGAGALCGGDRGNCLWVTFNRCSDTAVKPIPMLPAGRRARFARVDALRRELADAAAAPDVLLSPPPHRSAGRDGERAGGAASPLRFQVCGPGAASVPLPVASQNGAVPFRRASSPPPAAAAPARRGPDAAAAATPAAAGARPAKRVTQVLPWLMLTTSRLTASDLTRLASQRALGALLEYEVAADSEGHIALRRAPVGGHAAAATGGEATGAGASTSGGSGECGCSGEGGAAVVNVSSGEGSPILASATEAQPRAAGLQEARPEAAPAGAKASSAAPAEEAAAAAATAAAAPAEEAAAATAAATAAAAPADEVAAAAAPAEEAGAAAAAPADEVAAAAAPTTAAAGAAGAAEPAMAVAAAEAGGPGDNGNGGPEALPAAGEGPGSAQQDGGSSGDGDGDGDPSGQPLPLLVGSATAASSANSRGAMPIPEWPSASGSNRAIAASEARRAAAPAVISATGPSEDPAAAAERGRADALALAAAQLQRLAARRGAGHMRTGDTLLLLHHPEGAESAVATLLAGWLTWYGGLDADEAAAAVAASALGAPVDKALIEAASERLVARARAHFSRIVLVWPYGGMSADVSGELVGGWTERVPMRRCMSPAGCRGAARGQFLVELQGTRPGRYAYKFIIDNTWAVDPFAAKDLDGSGNWNNVCEVRAPPRIETPEERRHFAALSAALLAFEAKMGIGSGALTGRARRG